LNLSIVCLFLPCNVFPKPRWIHSLEKHRRIARIYH
jgi:hypothetical protein